MPAPTHLFHYTCLGRLLRYGQANAWQQAMVTDFLAHKAAISKREHSESSEQVPIPEAPTPSILTFSPDPVYTTGRRDIDSLTPSQIEALKQPLVNKDGTSSVADVVSTLRGGQTTFHGPGQIVIYPILDLRAIKTEKWPQGLSVRCYVNLLEQATIDTIATWGMHGVRTENPGVWLTDGPKGERKIAALGVHLRRNITSFGVGLNFSTDLRWFDRIVACGLVGKGTTRMADENDGDRTIRQTRQMKIVADVWVKEFVKGIWGPGEFHKKTGIADAPHAELLQESLLEPNIRTMR